jgi:protein-S-isoprenylcysteine O-methyltransferase Ste14
MAGAKAEPAAPKRMTNTIRWLARRRVLLGFVAGAAAVWLATPTRRSLAVGASIAIVGELIRMWAAGHLEKGREVTVSGPYRYTRHPLYAGSAVMGIGLAVAASSIAVALLVILYLSVTLAAAIRTEEAHLTEKFGPEYPRYRSGHAPSVSRRFSVARAFRNREYRALIGLAATLALLAWKAL